MYLSNLWQALQHTAMRSNTLQHTATHLICMYLISGRHCNTLQHTATHCNTLQHAATHLICIYLISGSNNMLQRASSTSSMLLLGGVVPEDEDCDGKMPFYMSNIYTYMHTCMYMSIHTWIQTYTYKHSHQYCAYIHTHQYCACIQTCKHNKNAHTHKHSCMQAYTRACTHAHTLN